MRLQDKLIIGNGLPMIPRRKLISRSNPQERFLRGFNHLPVARIIVVFSISHDRILDEIVLILWREAYHCKLINPEIGITSGCQLIEKKMECASSWR